MSKNEKQQLFFDLDRTLWDFEENSKTALNTLFHEYGLDKKVDHFIHFHEVYKRINKQLWEQYAQNKIDKEYLRIQRFAQTFEQLDIPDEKLAKKFDEGYISISPFQTQLFPNTKETLNELQKLGYRMSIITNGFEEVQHIKLKNCGIDHFFDEVVCSEQIGYSKPDKRVFEFALEKTSSVSENSVMIGDDIRGDVIGAEAVGIQGILFDPNRKKIYDSEITRISDLAQLPLKILELQSI